MSDQPKKPDSMEEDIRRLFLSESSSNDPLQESGVKPTLFRREEPRPSQRTDPNKDNKITTYKAYQQSLAALKQIASGSKKATKTELLGIYNTFKSLDDLGMIC